MVAAPVTGFLARNGGISPLAEAHEFAEPLLLAVHFGAALVHQPVVRDGLMDRMRRPQD